MVWVMKDLLIAAAAFLMFVTLPLLLAYGLGLILRFWL